MLCMCKSHLKAVYLGVQPISCWDVIVPGLINTQWVQNFRMSEETFIYLCNKLRPVMERVDTNAWRCVPLKKSLAITHHTGSFREAPSMVLDIISEKA